MRRLGRRLLMAFTVVMLALVLRAEMVHHAPHWTYAVPVAGIVFGLLYLDSTRRRP